MNNRYFILNADIMLEFYEECIKRGISETDVGAREKLLMEVGTKYKEFSAIDTDRTNEEIIQDLSKHRKKILHVKEDLGDQKIN